MLIVNLNMEFLSVMSKSELLMMNYQVIREEDTICKLLERTLLQLLALPMSLLEMHLTRLAKSHP